MFEESEAAALDSEKVKPVSASTTVTARAAKLCASVDGRAMASPAKAASPSEARMLDRVRCEMRKFENDPSPATVNGEFSAPRNQIIEVSRRQECVTSWLFVLKVTGG